MLDVFVRFDMDTFTLSNAAASKTFYYRPHEPQFMDTYGSDKVLIFGFPLSAKGKWHLTNNKELSYLDLSPLRIKTFGMLMSWRTLLYLLDIEKMVPTASQYTPTTGFD